MEVLIIKNRVVLVEVVMHFFVLFFGVFCWVFLPLAQVQGERTIYFFSVRA